MFENLRLTKDHLRAIEFHRGKILEESNLVLGGVVATPVKENDCLHWIGNLKLLPIPDPSPCYTCTMQDLGLLDDVPVCYDSASESDLAEDGEQQTDTHDNEDSVDDDSDNSENTGT